jgi:hypothetical protein
VTTLRLTFEPDDDGQVILEYDTANGDNFFVAHVNQFGVMEIVSTDGMTDKSHFAELEELATRLWPLI